jgi:glucose/arabinose dehydrogenase
VPELRVTEIAAGLANPVGRRRAARRARARHEREGRLTLLSGAQPGAVATPVDADLSDVYAEGEGGLMGLVVHADFAQTRRFTTCQTHAQDGSPTDVRLVTWELDGTSARRVADPLVGGLPIASSGRHSGCRPTLGADGSLLVGTGDTARGGVPQDLASLGGKVLRVDPATGGPLPTTRSPGPTTPPGSCCSPTGTATCRASRSPRTAPSTPPSTAPAPTTRSTGSCRAATSAGTRRRAARSAATTSRCR